jgi:hypothetical protein
MAPRITGAIRRDDTIQRLGGYGDNWYATWTADGSVLIALCDGTGFPGTERRVYNSRLFRLEGHPETGVTFQDVPGYPDLSTLASQGIEAIYDAPPRYYGFGTLAVDGSVYQFLSTWNIKIAAQMPPMGTMRFVGAKLIYSPDGGTTWHNQDHSTPVHWEDWDEQDDALTFFHEPDETFSLISILQMGKDYELNTDGYVYLYAPDGNDEGTMNRLALARVPKDRILDRSAYRFFSGWPGGEPAWTRDIANRQPVHTFPTGWVNKGDHPYAWQPSVTYNPALGVYLMANWATGPAEDGMWFGKESYLGLYQADTPWGPWTQFYEDTAWAPGGDAAARCYQPQIFPNWISDDGKSLWLVWTDFQQRWDNATEDAKRAELVARNASEDELMDLFAERMPYYSFNAVRVDLTTS